MNADLFWLTFKKQVRDPSSGAQWPYLWICSLFNNRTRARIYLLYSYCLCEPCLKASCANVDRATIKVEVALDSLVNGLHGPLSGKMSYDDI